MASATSSGRHFERHDDTLYTGTWQVLLRTRSLSYAGKRNRFAPDFSFLTGVSSDVCCSYAGQLKGKKSELIPEHEFHLKDSKDVSGATAPKRMAAAPGVVHHNVCSQQGRAVSATAQAKSAADHTVTTAARAATSSQVASVGELKLFVFLGECMDGCGALSHAGKVIQR